MKKIFFLFLSLFLLVSCGSTSSSESASTDFVEMSNAALTIKIPKTWTGVSSSTLPSPSRGVVVMAYTSPDAKNGFYNNLVVLEDSLNGVITSKDYASLNNLHSSKYYLQYTKISETPFEFADSDPSVIYDFQAKYNATTPMMTFLQTAKVCSGKVYLVHLSLALDRDPSLYLPVLKSLTCK